MQLNLTSLLVRNSLLAALIISSMTGCGTHEVFPDGEGKVAAKGASYYLPRTVIVANIPVTRTDKTAGDFAAFAEVFFQKKAKIQSDSVSFSLGPDATIEAVGERDSSQRYVSVFTKGMTRTATQIYSWNEQGVLNSGKATVENRTVEFAVSGVEAIAKLASSAGALSGENELYPDVSGLDDLKTYLNARDGSENSSDQIGPLSLRAGLAIVTDANPADRIEKLRTRHPDAVKGWEAFASKRKKGFALAKRAGEAFHAIQQDKDLIQTAASAEHRQMIQTHMDTLMAAFYGGSKKTTWPGQFRWTPTQEGSREIHLFDIDSGTGIATFKVKPEKSAMEVALHESSGTSGGNQSVKIELSVESAPPPQVIPTKCSGSKRGWYYRVPAQGTIKLTAGDLILATKRQGIGQLGAVESVPATGSGAKVVSDIELDPVTGALKSLTQGTVAFDSASMTRTATAGASYIDAEAKRNAAEDVEDDPLTKLKRQKDELELRAAIKAAQKALNAP